jgi:hypothetical protein
MGISQTNNSRVSVEAIVQRIIAFRQITPLDRQLLQSAMLASNGLNNKERFHISRVYEGIQKGLILVVE